MGGTIATGTATAAMGVSFGALGAGLVGYKYARREVQYVLRQYVLRLVAARAAVVRAATLMRESAERARNLACRSRDDWLRLPALPPLAVSRELAARCKGREARRRACFSRAAHDLDLILGRWAQGLIDELAFDLVDSSPGLPVTLGIAGWLDGCALPSSSFSLLLLTPLLLLLLLARPWCLH
jgi:hypothetical protein